MSDLSVSTSELHRQLVDSISNIDEVGSDAAYWEHHAVELAQAFAELQQKTEHERDTALAIITQTKKAMAGPWSYRGGPRLAIKVGEVWNALHGNGEPLEQHSNTPVDYTQKASWFTSIINKLDKWKEKF